MSKLRSIAELRAFYGRQIFTVANIASCFLKKKQCISVLYALRMEYNCDFYSVFIDREILLTVHTS